MSQSKFVTMDEVFAPGEITELQIKYLMAEVGLKGFREGDCRNSVLKFRRRDLVKLKCRIQAGDKEVIRALNHGILHKTPCKSA